uniref:Uncharacterized protein AlNc14C108G6299 n=1 Tax=Albugo laibachii Nc14 TaxID=890382 RepID=F0WI92_9STRA|nr:PREDICTED: similar to conserved hypothetical protein [Albugo laibachii Nc14]|eukprot:CCA20971.1 PREDICTED: similar to conserved hypothetical protein [Albugo laibachii Nc14]
MPTKTYSEQDVLTAIAESKSAAKIVDLVAKYKIPDRSLRRLINMEKIGKQKKRSGPLPVLGNALEKDLRDWVIGMQRKGFPPTRDIFINKGKRMYAALYGPTRDGGNRLSKGLATALTTTQWRAFLDAVRAIIEENAGPSRIFNLDETGFVQNLKTRKVIAVRGSKNVWSQNVEPGFHLTMVACVFADGFVVPPAFIVPGKRLNRNVLDACTISGATTKTSESGFMTTCIMREYIAAFALAVPLPIKRPLILVLDGASSYMDASIDAVAATYVVRLVPLPPNAIHLYQHWTSQFFARKDCHDQEGSCSVGVDCMAHENLRETRNIAAGFEEAGIWPLSLPMMLRRLKNFKENDSKAQQPLPSWLVTQQVIRSEILVLPPAPEKKGRRKTVDVKRRLLTQDDLRNE